MEFDGVLLGPRPELRPDWLGTVLHSQWVKAVNPNKTDQQVSELLEAKGGILKPRAQLRRTEEERDILEKAAAYFAREPG